MHPTFLDLFCGCGGFSLGMIRAGFQCLAAIDFNPQAISVFKSNFGDVPHILERDLTKFEPSELAKDLGQQAVDVIVGGPPCQGFSQARQRDGSNHGSRMVDDPRRQLYQRFLAFVAYFRPKVFVMENVLGIRSASEGEYFTRVQAEARLLGYRVVPREEDATKLGVPQNRKRQLFVGIRMDVPGYLAGNFEPAPRAKHWIGVNLGDAIMDLPVIPAGGGAQEMDYNLERRTNHTKGNTHHYIYGVLEVNRAAKLTAHEARPHSARDLGDFAKLREGENCHMAMRDRGVDFDFPYDKESFKDRYTRQSRLKPCSTIVAHMSKDGLMFIHPTQLRSLTPREAARVQTFPDWFVFSVTRTHQYRVIGNAVPPLVGEAVGLGVKQLLQSAEALERNESTKLISFKCASRSDAASLDTTVALSRLASLVHLAPNALRKESDSSFLQAWHSILFLYPDLHPDNAEDHGKDVRSGQGYVYGSLDLRDRYLRSGWPVALRNIGNEAWRRFRSGAIGMQDFYCIEAQRWGYLKSQPNMVGLCGGAA